MIPISDDNPTLRVPVTTYLLFGLTVFTWLFVQGAGFGRPLIESVCNLGLVAGELTGQAEVGSYVPIGQGLLCVVDEDAINWLTPITSMFLHGGWMHIIGNLLFFWVFGNNVEDSMGRLRFLVFYLLCGLIAAGAQVLVDPASPVPMVGASGAIAGVMGAYLVLYPTVRVNMLFIIFFIIRIFPLPAWVVLLYWIGIQLLSGFQTIGAQGQGGGVAFWAHIGGFVAGMVLIKPFERHAYFEKRSRIRHELHPNHP